MPQENGQAETETHPSPQRRTVRLAALRSGAIQNCRDLREDRADTRRDARHDRAGCHGHKTRHQSVLDEVLAACILQSLQFQN